jgi:hypothetical protein
VEQCLEWPNPPMVAQYYDSANRGLLDFYNIGTEPIAKNGSQRNISNSILNRCPILKYICRRFETGGSLSRRVNVAACPSPDGSTRGRARRGEVRWPETGVREVEIP